MSGTRASMKETTHFAARLVHDDSELAAAQSWALREHELECVAVVRRPHVVKRFDPLVHSGVALPYLTVIGIDEETLVAARALRPLLKAVD